MSSGSLQRIQKRALQKIIDMYNSPYSITEINSHSESYKKERERDGGGDYQRYACLNKNRKQKEKIIMKTFTISNLKGGVAKSTSTVNTAYSFQPAWEKGSCY